MKNNNNYVIIIMMIIIITIIKDTINIYAMLFSEALNFYYVYYIILYVTFQIIYNFVL